MNISEQAAAMMEDPAAYYGYSLTNMLSRPREEYDQLRLEGLKQRFKQYRENIPMLKKLADKQGINEVSSFNDVLPLLFDHTMYKSYPPSILHNCRFDQLTKWLDKLTTHDLSGFDAAKCKNVDEWLISLSEETPIKVCHSSGTTGTLSIIPYAKTDWIKNINQYPTLTFQKFGSDEIAEPLPLDMHAVYPHYRSGGTGHSTLNDAIVEVICGGHEEKLHTAYPGRLSSDMLLLGAKIKSAKAKGQLDKLKIPPDLIARREEFVKEQEEMPQRIKAFFNGISSELKGERVFMQAPSSMLYQTAVDGLEKGHKNIFAPNSVVVSGGGGKGIVLPDDWYKTVEEYLGINEVVRIYGMSEMMGVWRLCEHNHYHALPSVIPFIVDPDSSEPLPREGKKTGRFALYDLRPDSRWGGFITGDEVTMHWDEPCPCGRTTEYLEFHIQRYSDKKHGDDKITCAATADSYQEAMDFLTKVEG